MSATRHHTTLPTRGQDLDHDGAPEPGTLLIEDETLRAGFTQMPNRVLHARNLSRDAKILYMFLLRYAWQRGRCFPGYAQLCADMGASPSIVRKYMHELEGVGLLVQKRRGLGKTNLYTLCSLSTATLEPPLPPRRAETDDQTCGSLVFDDQNAPLSNALKGNPCSEEEDSIEKDSNEGGFDSKGPATHAAAKCGSCSAEINGYPRLMCKPRIDELAGQEINGHPMRTFPLTKDLVTDLSWNHQVNRQIAPLAPGADDGQPWIMYVQDVERLYEYRKCIECFLYQDVCHVLRVHHRQDAYVGPRFCVQLAYYAFQPKDTLRRTGFARRPAGIELCNIIKCCTEVCPEHIKITDTAVIPLKEQEQVADAYFDPLCWVLRKVTGQTRRNEGKARAWSRVVVRGRPLRYRDESHSGRCSAVVRLWQALLVFLRVADRALPTGCLHGASGRGGLSLRISEGGAIMDDRSRHARPGLVALSLLVLPLALAGCGGGSTAAGGSGSAGPTPTSGVAGAIGRVSSAYGGLASALRAATLPAWVKVGADGRSVALTITTTGFTFNGAANGKMTITVPQGWKISLTYHNTTSVAHSLVIAAQVGTPLPATGFTPALRGASTANPAVGQAHGTQQFSFTASPAGRYIMVCDVPGHADAGMWDRFDVSASAKVPAVKMR